MEIRQVNDENASQALISVIVAVIVGMGGAGGCCCDSPLTNQFSQVE